MKLTAYADLINRDLHLKYKHNEDTWLAYFEVAKIRDQSSDRVLESYLGKGSTIADAIYNYATLLRGNILIFNGAREFVVPDYLETD